MENTSKSYKQSIGIETHKRINDAISILGSTIARLRLKHKELSDDEITAALLRHIDKINQDKLKEINSSRND